MTPGQPLNGQPLNADERLELRQHRETLSLMVPLANGEYNAPELSAAIGKKAAELAITHLAQQRVQQQEQALAWTPPPYARTLAEEMALPRATHRYRIDGLAGHAHNVLVAGPRKVGKTSLMVNLSAALSLSRPDQPGVFLGTRQALLSGNVAYWDFENDPDDFRDEFRRLPAWALDAGRIRPLHLRGVPFPVAGNLAARSWAAGWLRQQEAEVLVIDTWGALAAACGVRNLNDDADVRRVLAALDEIKRATWVQTLFVLIHTPHQTGEKHLERFKGAGATGDWADALWTYFSDPAGTRYLSAIGRARIDMAEQALAWNADTGLLAVSGQGSRVQTSRDRMREAILTALAAAGPDGMLTQPLHDVAGGHRSDVPKVITQMVLEGEIEIEPGKGTAKIHRLRTEEKTAPRC